MAGDFNTTGWYDAALQAMVADSCLDGIRDFTPIDEDPDFDLLRRRLRSGNNPSGFSATLFRDNESGEYSLALRSTEFADRRDGGDAEHDSCEGADGVIFRNGLTRYLGELRVPLIRMLSCR